MKRRWLIVAITSMALIGAGIIVRAQRNHRRWAKWAAVYRIRAEQGDAKSQFELGAMYYYGEGVSKDYVEAGRWYRKAAEQGDANAQLSLAYMYHYGKGLPQDDLEAARWCRKAAEQGNATAQDVLGKIYRRGQGVWQRTTQSLSSGTENPPNKGTHRLDTISATCITTATVCLRTEPKPTDFSRKLPLRAMTMQSYLSVTGRAFQSTLVQD